MNKTYNAISRANKIAFAALAALSITAFAGGLAFAQQQTVHQVAAAMPMEVRVLEPVIVTAKRDVRKVARIEVVGYRSDVIAAQGGSISKVDRLASKVRS